MRNVFTARDDPQKPFLPVLIIPGFMSSGLQIVKSTYKESWEGKRVWINLQSLGFEALQFGVGGGTSTVTTSTTSKKATATDENEADGEETILRNMWLQHMALADDMVSEREGIQVRNIDGLAGVDYLTPGALTNYVSYVFGPVIRALQAAGYKEGHNLDAAPYDWRLPPSVMEERDQYFSRTIAQVETLYSKNKNTPVVLVCHSLGSKIGHYFLNFAKKVRGQEWLDQYIHTYMPVGGTHLGAPKALRSTVSGEKMGLDAFLSDSEALVFGRSLGSGICLIPKRLPVDAPSVVYIRSQGVIEVTIKERIDSDIFLFNRPEEHRPGKLKMTVVFDKSGLSTPFASIESDQTVTFDQTFCFRTQYDELPSVPLAILLCEPGVHLARRSNTKFYTRRQICFERFFGTWNCRCECSKSIVWNTAPFYFFRLITCWWLVWNLSRFVVEVTFKLFFGGTYATFCCLYAGTVLTADELSKISGGSSVLAGVKIPSVRDFLGDCDHREVELDLVSQRDKRRCCSCRRPKRTTKVSVSIKWIPVRSFLRTNDVCSPICQEEAGVHQTIGNLSNKRNDVTIYHAASGFDIIQGEYLERVINVVKNVYDSDPLDPRGLSSSPPPPVRLVKAIYGINLPTEVGAFYKRRRAVMTGADKIRSLFTLDKDARLYSQEGYVLEDGVLKETKDTRQLLKGVPSGDETYVCRSGDGTVPYWSLQHVRTWEKECHVSIDELEGADHREILADTRFHEILIDYVCTKPQIVESAV